MSTSPNASDQPSARSEPGWSGGHPVFQFNASASRAVRDYFRVEVRSIDQAELARLAPQAAASAVDVTFSFSVVALPSSSPSAGILLVVAAGLLAFVAVRRGRPGD